MVSHLHEAKIQIVVSIPPALLTEPVVAIQIYLNDLLLTHVPAVGGVVLSYSDLKLVDELGQIVDGSPLIHVRVKAKLVFYKLEQHQTIQCTVTSVSPAFIGLNFLDIFQVAVLAQKIESHSWKSTEAWTCKRTGVDLNVGDQIPVVVDLLLMTEGHLTIQGSLTDNASESDALPSARRSRAKGSGSRKRTSK